MSDLPMPPPPPAPASPAATAATPESAPAHVIETVAWQGLPDAAAQLAMAGGLIWGLVVGAASGMFLVFPLRTMHGGLSFWQSAGALAGTVALACMLGTWLGYRRWKFSAWKLDATGLHVRRGRWWQREVLVPRSRVQHLDIERGPIERNFGLATLVVHTAGIRTHALRQPGFADADAVALRDALVPASARHDDVL